MTAHTPIRRYPRKVEITRAIEAAKACGIDVGGFEVFPDGSIRIIEARGLAPANDEFARMEAAGLI